MDSPTGPHLGDAADDADARGHARAIEVEIDLGGHGVGLLDDLARERRGIAARLVDQHRQRRLERVREIADVGARPLDDLLVGLEQRVELLLQRLDLGGELAVEPRRLARADRRQALLHPRQREQAEADLEQGDGEQAEAGQRQRLNELAAEGGDVLLDLAQLAGDGDRVALRRLALAEHVDLLGDAHLLLRGPDQVGPAHLLVVGLDLVLAGHRQVVAGQRARAQ